MVKFIILSPIDELVFTLLLIGYFGVNGVEYLGSSEYRVNVCTLISTSGSESHIFFSQWAFLLLFHILLNPILTYLLAQEAYALTPNSIKKNSINAKDNNEPS